MSKDEFALLEPLSSVIRSNIEMTVACVDLLSNRLSLVEMQVVALHKLQAMPESYEKGVIRAQAADKAELISQSFDDKKLPDLLRNLKAASEQHKAAIMNLKAIFDPQP